MKEPKIFIDRSEIHRTYLCIYGTLGICLLGYGAMTAHYIYQRQQIPWLDVLTEVVLLFFLLSTAMARSTYELHEKELVVITTSFFRTRKLAIPYSAIDGAFHFKVEPIKTIAYRHTYRAYGSMDKREIWSLVYNLPHTDKVARLLMKASEEFWEEFEKRLPGRIRVSQDEVLRHAFAHISGADAKKNRKRAKKAAAAAAAAAAGTAAMNGEGAAPSPADDTPLSEDERIDEDMDYEGDDEDMDEDLDYEDEAELEEAPESTATDEADETDQDEVDETDEADADERSDEEEPRGEQKSR